MNEPRVSKQQHKQRRALSSATDILSRRALLAVGIAGIIIALLLFAWYIAQVLLLLLAGVLLAVLLRIPINFLAEHTPLSERWAFALVLLLIVGLLALGGWRFAPIIAEQFHQLTLVLPSGLAQLRSTLQQYIWGQWLLDQVSPLNTLMPAPSHIVGRITGIFSGVLNILTNLVIIVFAGAYLALQPEIYREGMLRLLPQQRRARGREVLHALGISLKWWLIGRLFSMVVLGVGTWLGLVIIGVPLAVPLGILSGLFNFIPIIGPVLALLPSAIVALTQSPMVLLYVVLLYYAIQIIESYILTPAVQQRAVFLPPVLALFIQLLMGVVAGLLGVALAFPVAVVVLVLVKMLYVEDVLGESVSVPGE